MSVHRFERAPRFELVLTDPVRYETDPVRYVNSREQELQAKTLAAAERVCNRKTKAAPSKPGRFAVGASCGAALRGADGDWQERAYLQATGRRWEDVYDLRPEQFGAPTRPGSPADPYGTSPDLRDDWEAYHLAYRLWHDSPRGDAWRAALRRHEERAAQFAYTGKRRGDAEILAACEVTEGVSDARSLIAAG